MAFPKLFKKKPPAAQKSEVPEEKNVEAQAGAAAPATGERSLDPASRGARGRRFVGVLIAPHQTEKAMAATGQGWYTFRVARNANKLLVKQAVEERYGVRVERVRMLSQKPKEIRRGRILGTVPGFKKAMVKVKAGQSIELT